MVEEFTDRFSAIDILINDAGEITVGPAQKWTEEDIHRSLDVMLWGPVHTTFSVVPQLRARGDG